jgi:asparagine synthase (glutamine-hydrolysing)
MALIGRAESAGGERAARDVNAISYLELSRYMRNVLLRDTDVMSMAHGLEVRVPLLDQELVELVARIPSEHKLASGRQKPLLVDAVRDLLPQAVVNRPKMGFTLPFERWMRSELHEAVAEVLLDQGTGGQVGQALQPSAVADVWRQFERGQTGWSRPWAIYAAKVWGEQYL